MTDVSRLIRRAAAIEILRIALFLVYYLLLIALGADVVFHDPVGLANAKKIYADAAFTFADTPVAAAKDADALIITTEWKDYAILDYAEVKRVM